MWRLGSRFERRIERRGRATKDPQGGLRILAEEARRARTEPELDWIAVELLEPLGDKHWEEIRPEFEAELAANPALRSVLHRSWLRGVPTEAEADLRALHERWTPPRSMRGPK